GVGWYNTKIDYNTQVDQGTKTNQEFGWHFGAGLEIPLGDPVALTGDFRYVFLDYNFEEVPGAGEINANFFIITAGLLFRIN
ncbi:MAG: outer membrane protein, partial [Ignavibacteria bacterium]